MSFPDLPHHQTLLGSHLTPLTLYLQGRQDDNPKGSIIPWKFVGIREFGKGLGSGEMQGGPPSKVVPGVLPVPARSIPGSLEAGGECRSPSPLWQLPELWGWHTGWMGYRMDGKLPHQILPLTTGKGNINLHFNTSRSCK